MEKPLPSNLSVRLPFAIKVKSRINKSGLLQATLLFLVPFMFAMLPGTATAQVHASPGKDGILNGAIATVNTYYPGTASVTAGANKAIPVGTPTGASAQIQKGDLVLIIQMQGSDMDVSNTSTYGTLTNTVAGTYEYAVATSSVVNGSFTVANLQNNYYHRSYSTSGQRQRFQVVRVPQYSSAVLGTNITSPAWNGETGGIVAMDVAGTLDFNGRTIDVGGKGFRGGAGRMLTGRTDQTGMFVYRTDSSIPVDGQKGEGIAGTPRYVYSGSTYTDTGVEGYINGSSSQGAPGNGGGGAYDGSPNNTMNSGGGGGSNAGAGGQGGNTYSSNSPRGGIGGRPFTSSASLLVMGGGGGAGSTNEGTGSPANGLASSGAAGGGIVMLRTGAVTGTGTITANGASANNTVDTDGSGGGGAGGSVLLSSVNTAGLTSITINARGGNGGSNSGLLYGPGGGGGGGIIYSNGTSLASWSADGGAAGTTFEHKSNGKITNYGATAGIAGNGYTTVTTTPNSASGALSLPELSVNVKTTTPVVVRGGTMEARYTITVSNKTNTGTAHGVSINQELPQFFTYKTGSYTITYSTNTSNSPDSDNGGTSGIVSSIPTPTFSTFTNGGINGIRIENFSIPSGEQVVINFVATIDATVPENTLMHSKGYISYLDPTRTTATRRISPDNIHTSSNYIYESGSVSGLDVPGTNYSLVAANTGDDVIVTTAPTTNDVTNTMAAAIPSTNGPTAISPFAGADTTPGTVTKYIVKSIPNAATQGTLFLNTTPLVVGSEVLVSQLSNLKFDPVDAAVTGNVTFTYAAVDNNGVEDATPATYTIPVVHNDRPVAPDFTAPKMLNTAAATAIGTSTPTDDKNPLVIKNFRFTTIPNATTQGVLQINGTAIVKDQNYAWSSFQNVTFDPVAGNLADVTFTYTVLDGDDAEDLTPGTITVPINGEPIAEDVTNSKPISSSAAVTLIDALRGNDPDGTLSQFQIKQLPTAAQGILYVNGVVATLNTDYSWALRDKLAFDPAPGNSANVSFTYTVKDNEDAYDATPATFTIPIIADKDLDGIADANDLDNDNDGIPDSIEGTGDKDGDGIPNNLDLDSDGDGIYDAVEANNGKVPVANFDLNTGRYISAVGANGLADARETAIDSGIINYDVPDTDKDKIYDFLDLDSDNDGILDNLEAQATRQLPAKADTDADGMDDKYDASCGCATAGTSITPVDTDSDSIPDYLDTDSDNDLMTDTEEAFDIDNSGSSANDLLKLAQNFSTQAGILPAASYYPVPSSKEILPNWLKEYDKAKRVLNFQQFGSAYYYDTDGDGLVDLFDADSHGEDKSSFLNNAFRNPGIITPLPVELVYFTAVYQNDKVVLQWLTASELNNERFEVERSADGKKFVKIGTVAGKGTSNVANRYSFTDARPLTGVGHYRLRQVDFDGQTSYSRIVAVNNKALEKNAVLQAYPNPFEEKLTVTITVPAAEQATLMLYNMQGRQLITKKVTLEKGVTTFDLETSQLAQGIYILRISGSDTDTNLKVMKR